MRIIERLKNLFRKFTFKKNKTYTEQEKAMIRLNAKNRL